MEAFSISCPTCQARLRVRDPSIIGQIQTCPKCGSMVFIEAPSTPHPPRATEADTLADPLGNGPAGPDAQVGDAASPDELFTTPSEWESGPSSVGPSTAAPAPDAVAGPASAEHQVSRDVGPRRRVLLVVAAMLGGLLIAGGALAVFFYSRGTPVAAGPSPNGPSAPPPSIPSPTVPPAVAAELMPSQETESPAPPPATVTPPSPSTTTPESPSQPPTTPPTPPAPEPAPVAGTTEAPATSVTPATPDAGAKPPTAAAPEPTKAIDAPPSEPTPESQPPLLTPRGSATTSANRVAPGGGLTETLQRLRGLLDAEEKPEEKAADAAAPATAATPAAPPAAVPALAPATPATPATPPEPPVSATVVPRGAPVAVDVTARLSDPLLGVETSSPVALTDFLDLVSSVSTIPITLDPERLVWLKVTPQTPVTVRVGGTTVRDLLNAGLKPIRLAATATERSVWVSPVAGEPGALRKSQRSVGDLVGGDASRANHLRELLIRLIEPDSWEAAGGKGQLSISGDTLHLEQSDQVIWDASIFLERLRVVRGLPPQNKNFEPELFQPATRTSRASATLEKPVAVNSSRPLALHLAVRRLAEAAGVYLVVDWGSLAAVGWTRDSEVPLELTELPLREALQRFLEPLELGYRLIDAQTIQITTLETRDALAEVEFYPVAGLVGDDETGERLQQRLQTELPPLLKDSAPQPYVVAYDPPSRTLVVRGPQPTQQLLEKLLQDWMAGSR